MLIDLVLCLGGLFRDLYDLPLDLDLCHFLFHFRGFLFRPDDFLLLNLAPLPDVLLPPESDLPFDLDLHRLPLDLCLLFLRFSLLKRFFRFRLQKRHMSRGLVSDLVCDLLPDIVLDLDLAGGE